MPNPDPRWEAILRRRRQQDIALRMAVVVALASTVILWPTARIVVAILMLVAPLRAASAIIEEGLDKLVRWFLRPWRRTHRRPLRTRSRIPPEEDRLETAG
jgi:hypothetical protein